MPKTNFRPEVDGFAFINSWVYDDNETQEVRALLQGAASLTGILRSVLPANPLVGLISRDVQNQLIPSINNALLERYGLCGGMAFAALDYYSNPNRNIPRGTDSNVQPTRDTPQGAILRSYLWRRLIDSLTANVSTFLLWIAFLHHVPDNAWLGGGPRWLSRQSLKECQKLKRYLDAGQPWPVGLVGTTPVATEDHQVVAYDYTESSDGSTTFYLYDMNCPGTGKTTTITFGDGRLKAVEQCSGGRGPLQGFFCEQYAINPDPPAVSWP